MYLGDPRHCGELGGHLDDWRRRNEQWPIHRREIPGYDPLEETNEAKEKVGFIQFSRCCRVQGGLFSLCAIVAVWLVLPIVGAQEHFPRNCTDAFGVLGSLCHAELSSHQLGAGVLFAAPAAYTLLQFHHYMFVAKDPEADLEGGGAARVPLGYGAKEKGAYVFILIFAFDFTGLGRGCEKCNARGLFQETCTVIWILVALWAMLATAAAGAGEHVEGGRRGCREVRSFAVALAARCFLAFIMDSFWAVGCFPAVVNNRCIPGGSANLYSTSNLSAHTLLVCFNCASAQRSAARPFLSPAAPDDEKDVACARASVAALRRRLRVAESRVSGQCRANSLHVRAIFFGHGSLRI